MTERIPIHDEVIDFLSSLVSSGWKIVFVTGRPYVLAIQALHKLSFPYYLAVINGATILEMPSKKVIAQHSLTFDVIPEMELICENLPTDFVLISGFQNEDVCYYRPGHYPPELLHYIQERYTANREPWHAVPSFTGLPITSFSAIKCIGDQATIDSIADQMTERLELHATPIRDPFSRDDHFVAQATKKEADKGRVIVELKQLLNISGKVIAAGDDNNDRSMLEAADMRIVMSTAPLDLQDLAHVVAPSAADKGIIQGIKKALESL